MDPSFGRWSRALPLLAIAVLEVGIGTLQNTHVVSPTARTMMSIICVVIVVTALASIALRRKIFGHPYNRRVWALLAVTLAAMFVNRVTMFATTQDVVRALTADLFAVVAMLAAGSLIVTPRLFVAMAIVGVAWVLAMAQPELTVTLFPFGLAFATVAAAWAVATSRRTEIAS
jgi:hypothetical protein